MTQFEGIGIDGKPATFLLPDGRWYAYICPDCNGINGGGIETAQYPAGFHDDEYSPTKTPCFHCGKGPMVIRYDDEATA